MHWESWLEKVNTSSDGTDLERSNIDDSLLLDTDKPKKKIPLRMDDDKGGAFDDSGFYNKASWETWLDKNNAIETSHKEGEKKEEWNGKFDNSTTRDGVKDEDDKAVSEEKPLEELTDGKLEEVEKLKSWELWLEKYDKDPNPEETDPEKIMQNAEVVGRKDNPMIKDMYKSWLEKMQGAGDARYGNQHLTGMEQHPVDDDESIDLSAESDKNNEKQEKTEKNDSKDNKPYKALS